MVWMGPALGQDHALVAVDFLYLLARQVAHVAQIGSDKITGCAYLSTR